MLDGRSRNSQWPVPDFQSTPKEELNSKGKYELQNIEKYITDELGAKALLVPSVRSGMSQVLQALNVNRDKTVFITKYTSHCLFTSLGAFTNVTTTNLIQDVTVLNHKWGFENSHKKNTNKSLVLDDSCDSYFTSDFEHFKNDELASFISLPKVIGSFTGGVVLINKENPKSELILEKLSEFQNLNQDLGIWQEQQKIKDFSGRDANDFSNWFYWEYSNTFLPSKSILEIGSKIARYSKWGSLTRDRNSKFQKTDLFIGNSLDRQGPVMLYQVRNEAQRKRFIHLGFLIRKFDVNQSNDSNSKYVEVALLPIHGGISNLEMDQNYDDFISCL